MTRVRCAALALAVLAACAVPAAPYDAAGPLRADRARVDLVLTPRTGEVWAWDVEVRAAAGGTPLSRCWETTSGREAEGHALRVPLAEGPNEIHVACRDASGDLHEAPPARFDRRLPEAPEARIDAHETPSGLELDGGGSVPHGAPLSAFAWSGVSSAEGPRARLTAPGLVRLRVEDQRGLVAEASVRVVRDGARLVVRDGAARRAEAADLGVVYGVHPPLYGTPGLRAVTRELVSLAELGVDVVWLSPPYAAPPGDFGYAVTDPFRLREEAGSEADLRALVEEGHRLGLRVVLDFVPNHTSDRHPWFLEAAASGPATHAYRFHERDAEGRPTHYFDWRNLPNLDYRVGRGS